MKKKLLMMVVFATVLLTACGKHSVDLNDYISVEFSGGDGIGVARVVFDSSALNSELQENYSGAPVNAYDDVNKIVRSISYDTDVTNDLSNGDKVTLSIEWNDDYASDSKFKLSGKETTYKVSGLTERVELDLFADVELVLDGVSPNATVLVSNTSTNKNLENVRYSLDKYNVANGDEVTVTAYGNLSENEFIIDTYEKTYIVDGADEYAKAYSDLDDSALERLKSQAEDVLTSELANRSSYLSLMHQNSYAYGFDIASVNIKSKELDSAYFATFKDGLQRSYSDVYNSIFLVYEVTATDGKSEGEVTALVTVYCKNFIKRDSGEATFEISNVVINKGYADVEQLKTNIVDTNKAKYEFEIIDFN